MANNYANCSTFASRSCRRGAGSGVGTRGGGGQSLPPQGPRLGGQRDAGLALHPCEMLGVSASEGTGGAALGGLHPSKNSARSR